jgi:hypothetical protein
MQLLKAPKEADIDLIAAPDGTVRMLETVLRVTQLPALVLRELESPYSFG